MAQRIALYCGMADDITNLLMLVPGAHTFYAISLFDSAFCTGQTWKHQKIDILNILRLGHDVLSQHFLVYMRQGGNQTDLPLGPCTDIHEEDDGNVWRVAFTYGGIPRTLTYIHNTDYYEYVWAPEIQGITDLISIGATFDLKEPTLRDMLKTRLTPSVRYYTHQYPGGIYDKIVQPPHCRDPSPVAVIEGTHWLTRAQQNDDILGKW